jgi:tetrahydromethanopterin S-methyltransferase subunit C
MTAMHTTRPSLRGWLADKMPGVLAGVATFSVSAILVIALGAPVFLFVVPVVLSYLVGRVALNQDRDNR